MQSNSVEFTLKRPTGLYQRYTGIIALTRQDGTFVGMYIISITTTTEKITKISGADASITRENDTIVKLAIPSTNNIYANGLLIAPRSLTV